MTTTAQAIDTGWQPIDTAPRDGTWVELLVEHLNGTPYPVENCRWATIGGEAAWVASGWLMRGRERVEGFKHHGQRHPIRATHWRPNH